MNLQRGVWKIYSTLIYTPSRLVNMAPLVAGDGQVLANGELDEYLQRNLDKAKVRLRIYSF